MQVLAVAAGGTLDQHLPELVGHSGHSPAVDGYGWHGVRLAEGSWLRGVLGERVDVPTHHHQGVRSHPGLVATGWADDGVVEALETPGASLRVGVQWHPEVGEDHRLFDAFVSSLA
jgi:putative glutamine amidotransferase